MGNTGTDAAEIPARAADVSGRIDAKSLKVAEHFSQGTVGSFTIRPTQWPECARPEVDFPFAASIKLYFKHGRSQGFARPDFDARRAEVQKARLVGQADTRRWPNRAPS
jgi:hypothetical protein